MLAVPLATVMSPKTNPVTFSEKVAVAVKAPLTAVNPLGPVTNTVGAWPSPVVKLNVVVSLIPA